MWFDIIKIDDYEQATAEQFADAEDLKLDSQKEKEVEEARKEKEIKDWLEKIKGIWIKLYRDLPSSDDWVRVGDMYDGYDEIPSKHFYHKKIKRLTLNNPEERTKRLDSFEVIHMLVYDYIEGFIGGDFSTWPKDKNDFDHQLVEEANNDDGDEVNKFKQLYN